MEQRDIDDDRADQSPVNETPLPLGAGHSATSSAADTARKGAGAGIVGLLIAAKVGLLKRFRLGHRGRP